MPAWRPRRWPRPAASRGEIRKLGFPRFESLAWTKIAQGILVDRVSAQALLTRSEGLLPEGHPDRISVLALKALLEGKPTNGRVDRTVAEELQALVALARAVAGGPLPGK